MRSPSSISTASLSCSFLWLIEAGHRSAESGAAQVVFLSEFLADKTAFPDELKGVSPSCLYLWFAFYDPPPAE
jgi:hypothetical protein